MSVTIIDFVENALGWSAAEVRALIREQPGYILAQRQDFMHLLGETWLPRPIREEIDRRIGSARISPIFGRSLRSTTTGLPMSFRGDDLSGSLASEVKALLLYADEVIFQNPLLGDVTVSKGQLVNTPPIADSAFLSALHSICELAELIRSGVVVVADSEPPEWEAIDVTEPVIRALTTKDNLGWSDTQSYLQAEDSLLRAINLAISGALDSPSVTISASTLLTDTAFMSRLLTSLADGQEFGPLVAQPDRINLARIATLKLPGVTSITPSAMQTVREEDAFRTFRSAMRDALAEVDAVDLDADLVYAQGAIADFMHAQAEQLSSDSRVKRFYDATAGDTVAWGVGASLTSLGQWRSALLGILAKGTLAALPPSASLGQRALHQHYISLGKSKPDFRGLNALDAMHSWKKRSR